MTGEIPNGATKCANLGRGILRSVALFPGAIVSALCMHISLVPAQFALQKPPGITTSHEGIHHQACRRYQPATKGRKETTSTIHSACLLCHDVGMVCKFFDVGMVCKFFDVGMVCKFFDVGMVCKFFDVGTVCKFFDVGMVCKFFDVGMVCKFFDVGMVCKFVDVGMVCKFFDVGMVCKFFDVGMVCKFFDVGMVCKFFSDISELVPHFLHRISPFHVSHVPTPEGREWGGCCLDAAVKTFLIATAFTAALVEGQVSVLSM